MKLFDGIVTHFYGPGRGEEGPLGQPPLSTQRIAHINKGLLRTDHFCASLTLCIGYIGSRFPAGRPAASTVRDAKADSATEYARTHTDEDDGQCGEMTIRCKR